MVKIYLFGEMTDKQIKNITIPYKVHKNGQFISLTSWFNLQILCFYVNFSSKNQQNKRRILVYNASVLVKRNQ